MNKTGASVNIDKVNNKSDNKKLWKRFILNISLVIILFIVGVFIGVMIRNNQLINDEIISSARSYFQNILLTRRWNADYGGVFVEKKTGMQSNPYLENPDIHTVNGKVYTKKNPALMTREISRYAEEEGMFRFNITSLNPLNPHNKANPFETAALNLFEQGKKEFYRTEKLGENYYFNYMAPLPVVKSCLQCHAKQGYRVGDIRGGISVTLDVTNVRKTLKSQNRLITILSIVTAFILLGIIYLFVMKLNTRLSEAYKKISVMAMEDELTGLYNRRYFFGRLQEEFVRARRYMSHLACIMLDLDRFKAINDIYGHHVGDQVLREISKVIKENCRQSDVVARYGGEEIVILLPSSTKNDAVLVARKLRNLIEIKRIILEDKQEIDVTASFGVTGYSPAQLHELKDHNSVIKNADKAMYQAKLNGRNRVESI
jgi:diguanylate cyclase (GGDEF)-like protein